jgi:rod shape-determining protein MreD
MSILLKNIFRFIFFILVQAYILDKVPPLHQYVKPILYFLFILWLPFSINRNALMIIAFLFGLCMDNFTGTPGLHAIPAVLVAYLRPFLLNLLLPKETTEQSYFEPSITSLGGMPYFVYILFLTFLHNASLVLIEWLQFGDFVFFIGKVAATTAISLLLIFVTEMLFPRKAKYRTNTATLT